jgi:hypothetical protein
MKTRVVHVKKESYEIFIGRPSKWGNPFRIGKDGTREQVIEKYRNWISKNPDLLGSISELRGRVLGCWCKPLSCHGDILAELAENQQNTNENRIRR